MRRSQSPPLDFAACWLREVSGGRHAPLPGLPDVVTTLATGLATLEPIPAEETARTFGVQLTSLDEVIPRLIPPIVLRPVAPA